MHVQKNCSLRSNNDLVDKNNIGLICFLKKKTLLRGFFVFKSNPYWSVVTTLLITTRTNTISSGMIAILITLPSFLSFSLSDAVASSFWINRLNKTRMPVKAKDPASVIVEIVDVVTVDIIVIVELIELQLSQYALYCYWMNNNRKEAVVKGLNGFNTCETILGIIQGGNVQYTA